MLRIYQYMPNFQLLMKTGLEIIVLEHPFLTVMQGKAF